MQIPQSGETLLNVVRAGFILQGTSLFKWCRENDFQYQNVKLYILGYGGERAREIKDKAIQNSVLGFSFLLDLNKNCL